MERRMVISLAIVRFVNGVTDTAQRGTRAVSVAHLARTLQLPRVLVDVRHESTHSQLPSLTLLETAVDQVRLDWFR
jgi:cobyrinic acid a,c-diamide synthase